MIRELLKSHLENQDINIITKAKIKTIDQTKIVLDGQDDVSFDTLLVATGRQPNTQVAKDLNLEMDGKFFKVDDHYQTSQKHVYAIGDLVKGYQLACCKCTWYSCSRNTCWRTPTTCSSKRTLRCIYTRLEAASIGLSEEQAKKRDMM